MRAARDPELAIEDLRVLICVGILVGASGSCVEDVGWIASHARLPEPVALARLERLAMQGYLHRQGAGGTTTLSLAPDSPAPIDSGTRPASPDRASSSQHRGSSRSGQASLHSGMLRRPTRRQSGTIEFDDPLPPHPVVASFLDSLQTNPGGVDRFRFWLRTILDPEDVEIFSGWAGRQSAEFRKLVDKFDSARDDQTIESLLEDTLALVNREKAPDR